MDFECEVRDVTSRERALATYAFQKTDVPCFDLMEGIVWPSLRQGFKQKYDLSGDEEIQTTLGSDFRWLIFNTEFLPEGSPLDDDIDNSSYTDDLGIRLLQNAQSVNEIRDALGFDPSRVEIPDFKAFRERYPKKALICCPAWMPCFSGACHHFGMVTALSLMAERPKLIEAYVKLQCEYALEVIQRCLKADAHKYCDFFWLGDDFSGESSMLLSPHMWRALFKDALRVQVQEARAAGMLVMFHSCGDVAAVYEDFIEIGINAHAGVQTSCMDMSAERLAATIGGRLVIHGGVDAQTTLVNENCDGVVRSTRMNIEAFAKCGGYVVSNSHHSLDDIGAEKIVAMSVGAGRWTRY